MARCSTTRNASPWAPFRKARANADPGRVYSAPNDRPRGSVCDQTVALKGLYSRKRYPRHLRRIRFKNPRSGKDPVFLTKLFGLPPLTVCELYKARWQIELFFNSWSIAYGSISYACGAASS